MNILSASKTIYKKNTLALVALFAVVLATSCSSNGDNYIIGQTVFIEDKSNPGLPIYSELGYNSFGAYWDRGAFISERYKAPTKVLVRTDTCHWQFNGTIEGRAYMLTFSFPDFLPKQHEDMLWFDNQKTDLTDSEKCCVFLNDGSTNTKLTILEGEMEIKRAQKLYVDRELYRTVLSGRFSFKAIDNDIPYSFSSGRFDLGIGDDNFFNLQNKK